jgi:2-hydroxy-6-oxonona-2,4-dienedioate hydrolase
MVISSLYMVPLGERLAEMGFEVHAVDLPGYGRSVKPPAPLDVQALADSVAAWVKAQGGGAWHVVGNSMGCQVGADLAVRHPDAVATLTLIGMTVDPTEPTLFQQALRLFRDVPREPLRLWFDQIVDYLRAGPRFVVGAMRGMIADRIETKLPFITAPTLVMRGEHDPVTPRSFTDAAMAMLPHGSFVEIPDGSHAVHFAAPKAVAEAIRTFAER